ncbi:BQ2448_5065 [Microbotryum intermedium]|uniref:BQ2448_5065 protein n=1 Tax=Microbotryum intermedium TaxID=269621 RepID=A0A238F6H9_9BASI|nr:BQ2448_5065 [Microbotryum intermedium]
MHIRTAVFILFDLVNGNIMGALNAEIKGTVTYCDSAYEMWSHLEKLFRKRGHKCALQRPP